MKISYYIGRLKDPIPSEIQPQNVELIVVEETNDENAKNRLKTKAQKNNQRVLEIFKVLAIEEIPLS